MIDFADAPSGGAILDIAHGSGESLALHLQANPSPTHLHGLTSLQAETDAARELLGRIPITNTSIELFTSSASYRAGKDFDHPLNPMRGFLGQQSRLLEEDTTGYEDEDEQQDVLQVSAAPPPYDLVYILDAIYHFPPAVPYFLASVFKVLRPGVGVVAYTDIIPPAQVSNPLARLILPWVLSVPTRNIANRPANLEEYANLLEKIGYEDIRIEDWSDAVWKGFASNLRQRSWPWQQVAKVVEAADRTGWRFIAVRGRRGEVESHREKS